MIDVFTWKMWSYDLRNNQALLSKVDFCLLLSPKHLLIVGQADFFAEAKFWLIKICASELGWTILSEGSPKGGL